MTAPLPDATELADQLEHARTTREHLDRVIAWLEEGVELLGAPAGVRPHEPLPAPPAGDAAVPERALPPGNMRAEYSSSDSSTSSEEPKSEQPDDEPDLSRSEERPQVPTTTRKQDGDGVSGADSDRTGMGPAGSAAGTAPVRVGQRDRDAKILHAVLTANAPLSKREIVDRTGLLPSQVSAGLQRLAAAEQLVAEGATKSRRYRKAEHQAHSAHGKRSAAGIARSAAKITDAVARVGLRDRIMKAVSADPAALDNHRLALALNATLEDVADACQWLVSKDKVQMADDGTYLRSAAEAAREVAAA